MFERFTDRARRVVVLAQEEARLLDHNYIGTEHLLLGLMEEHEGVAAQALGSFGIAADAVRTDVERRVGRGPGAPAAHIPFTPRAKKVLELSLREALQLQDNHIGTEHVLLGLVREGDGIAVEVLVALGADLSQLRERVVQMRLEVPHETPFTGHVATAPLGSRRAATELSPPRCPRCAATLASATGYRAVEAAGAEPDDEPMRVVIVYCVQCGIALGTTS